ncbi:MAG: hypothetical protein M1828_002340 [Chrysothrix sp. TS-e1954]|nr:MAG: hypothetical protein M1828_002340 [Chrysothrix sp. TS-e1954]
MAEPISVASGLLTLAAFALQSSKMLYELVESFRSNRRIIRELKEELAALDGVLQSLYQAAGHNDADLTGLKLPVLRCGKACADFNAIIVKCTTHSGESRTSFQDWAKLKYIGDDIAGFKNMLTGYKSTISIALGGANLVSDEGATEREQIQEEMNCTKQCLRVCAMVSEHINQVEPTVFEALNSKDTSRKLTADSKASHKELGQQANIRLSISGYRRKKQASNNISATHDAHQVIVATLGDLITARRITAGARSTQWLGQMSDASLQQLSKDRSPVTMKKTMKPQSGET